MPMSTSKGADTTRRLGHWLVAAIGTLSVGLAAVWVNQRFGPQSSDPCARYVPRGKAYSRQTMDQVFENAEPDTSLPRRRVVEGMIERGHFTQWVIECGTNEGQYERAFPLVPAFGGIELPGKLRIVPHAVFRSEDGRDCRTLDVSAVGADDRWQSVSSASA